MMTDIRTKRIYDAASQDDGLRVLVDRVWPRGVSRKDAKIDCWPKDVAPTTDLRKWFGHDPNKWSQFQTLYLDELESKSEQIEAMMEKDKGTRITLLYSAKNRQYNHAVVLKDVLDRM